MSEAPLTSEDIFLQYCQAKPDKATEFINDYILYCLDKIEEVIQNYSALLSQSNRISKKTE